MATTSNHALKWDVFVTPGIPTVTTDLPPNTTRRTFSPTSSTLIYGRREAVLVDALMTVEQAKSLRAWIEAHVEPRAVIAGHKRAENDDDPRIIEETRQYIRDFERVAGATKTARELYDQMLELYPKRVNPGALWSSARAVKPSGSEGRA
jgi:hypothetical protein